MTHAEIAKQITVNIFLSFEDEYWISYQFGSKNVNLCLEKTSESDLLALVEGEMCQFEALSIAIMNEVQKEANALAHRSNKAVNNLHPLFQDILKPFTTSKKI